MALILCMLLVIYKLGDRMKKFLLLTLLALGLVHPVQAQVVNGEQFILNHVCVIRSGSGTPEGAIVGDICDVYLRTNGSTDTTIYVKESGSSNTGWIPLGSSTSGAPTNATYIVQTANGSLSAEQALSTLASGYAKITTVTGVISSQAVPIPVADGGLNLTTATDDQLPLGNGTTWQSKAVPDCTDTAGNHINYTASTNTFSCGTSGGGSGAPTTATYITQTADAGLSAEQALGGLSTGIMKSTTTTGVVSTLAIPLTMANGGTDVSTASDDQVLVNSGSAWVAKTVTNCTDTGGNHINYTQSTNTFSCGTSSSSSGAGLGANTFTDTQTVHVASGVDKGFYSTNDGTGATDAPTFFLTNPYTIGAFFLTTAAHGTIPTSLGFYSGSASNGIIMYPNAKRALRIQPAVSYFYGDGDAGQVGIGRSPTSSYLLDVDGTANITGAVTLGSTLNVTGLVTATAAGISVPTSALGTVFSSAYTPSLSAGSNVAASTPKSTNYTRVGNRVTVTGEIDIDPTAASAVYFELNLPVASNLANTFELSGVLVNEGNIPGNILGEVTNNTAGFSFTPTSAANQGVYFTFGYQIF